MDPQILRAFFWGGRLVPAFCFYIHMSIICQYKRLVALALMLYDKKFFIGIERPENKKSAKPQLSCIEKQFVLGFGCPAGKDLVRK